MNITKPIAPDTLIERLTRLANAHHVDSDAAAEAKATLEANNRQLQLCREALTPSGDTKAAYHGEFSFSLTRVDEAGDEYPEKVYVPWDTVKEIMAAIRDRVSIEGVGE